MIVGTAAAQAPAEEWNNTFDIGLHDYAWSVQQTSPDGGYILAGVSGSDNFDALLIKTDYNGNEMWNKTLDNALWDYAESVQQTSDGGYILAGTTLSDQGLDAWLIKTNETGVEQWNKTFGGTGADQASSVQQTSDGGYILAGYTGVVDTGVKDVWLIKTNETGVEEWNNTFGGINDDMALSVQQTSDGGYILAGSKSTSTPAEDSDAWLIKTDRNGDLEWDMTFAGATSNSEEEVRSVQQTSDGGYILAGYTGPRYLPDAWLIKTSETGVEEWNKTFGTEYDYAYSVQQTSDGGYILAGSTMADNAESSGWLIKTDSAGIEEWNIKLNDGGATSVRQTLDGGYILAGITGSEYSSDALLVKIAGTGQAVTTHYVGDGGYTTIQAAVDTAADGDTIIVYPGTYTENVNVNKELTIMSQSGNPEDTVVKAGNSLTHVFNVTADNVSISGFNVTGIISDDSGMYWAGIYLEGVKGCTIENNFFTNDAAGIWVNNSAANMLTSNIALNNSVSGIILWNSSNNVLNNNIASNSSTGIAMLYSSDNTLNNSTVVENTRYGILMLSSGNNVLSNNMVVNSSIFGIIMQSSSNNVLSNNMVANSTNIGILMTDSNNGELTGNIVTNGLYGIRMLSSTNNTLTSNMVTNNRERGIYFYMSNNNTLSNNSVTGNGLGFYLEDSSNNLIYNNCFANIKNLELVNYNPGSNTWNSEEMLTYTYQDSIFTSYIGNNYSDYTGADSNGDGIGDTSYAEDSYPLMFWPVEPIEKPPVTEIEPVADAGGPYSAVEGSEIIFDASESYDPDGVYLEYRWDFESNGTWTTWSTEKAATHTWNDDWTGTVTVEVSDGELNNTSTAAVIVTNADPVLGAIVTPTESCQVNTLVSVSGTFSDPGILDTHTAVWDWGDGTTDTGIVNENNGAGTVTGEHSYTTAGTYWVTLNVTDDDGGSANVTSQQYVVVYDPSAGYVTGAGWIQSPAGAYASVPSFAGKGTLKISAKSAKGAALPSMTTEFSIKSKTVNMKFKSTSYDGIVINGAYAKYTGSGTFNGAGNHGYMVSVVDGDIAGDYIDKFRIKIWNKSTGKVVYDNEMGVSEDMQPTTILTGSIVIRVIN